MILTPEENWKQYRIRYTQKRNMNEFRDVMVAIVKLFKPHTYVELGIRGGYTFNEIAPMDEIELAVAVEIKGRQLVGAYKSDKTMHLPLSTDLAARVWEAYGSSPIDFLFIDADHSKAQALKDFDNWSKFMSPCGIIAMHDTYPMNKDHNTYCGAWEAAKEIHTSEKYKDWEIFTFPGTWVGMSLVRNVKKYLHWMEDEKTTTETVITTTTTTPEEGAKS